MEHNLSLNVLPTLVVIVIFLGSVVVASKSTSQILRTALVCGLIFPVGVVVFLLAILLYAANRVFETLSVGTAKLLRGISALMGVLKEAAISQK